VSRDARVQRRRFRPVAEVSPNERVIDLRGIEALGGRIARQTIEAGAQSLVGDLIQELRPGSGERHTAGRPVSPPIHRNAALRFALWLARVLAVIPRGR
jgi:hypothetical protein